MPEISVQQAAPGQSALVARFVHALLQELGKGKGPALADLEKIARQVLPDPGVTALIASTQTTSAGAEPIGVMVLNQGTAIYAGGTLGQITERYVLPEWRSHGVAAQLIREAVALARARGWQRLEVGAPSQPEWARSLQFYQRQGFEVIGPRLRLLV